MRTYMRSLAFRSWTISNHVCVTVLILSIFILAYPETKLLHILVFAYRWVFNYVKLEICTHYLLSLLLSEFHYFWIKNLCLTSGNRVLPEKRIVCQLVKRSYEFSGTRGFMTVFTRECHLFLPWSSPHLHISFLQHKLYIIFPPPFTTRSY
jgi:hypothetical protein